MDALKSIFDYARADRIGMPESVLCEGKSLADLRDILSEISGKQDYPVLLTRLSAAAYSGIPEDLQRCIDFDPESRTGIINGCRPRVEGRVAVVAAGTSDSGVAKEAARTLEFLGLSVVPIFDVGVAGLWRLLDRIEAISACDAAIAIAGMDGGMPTVLTGLVPLPVIGVPTSTGYGVAAGGTAALNAMLTSCAQGLVVTNIDNGFGAACAAYRIIVGRDGIRSNG